MTVEQSKMVVKRQIASKLLMNFVFWKETPSRKDEKRADANSTKEILGITRAEARAV